MPLDQITTYFFTQGILGTIVIVLAIVIILQDRRNRLDLEKLTNANASIYEKRITDSNMYSERFIKTSETLFNQNKEIMTLIQGNQKALETVAIILQNLKR